MERDEHVHWLRVEGARMADAAEAAGLDAKVPTCPDWRVRDLLRHTGGVHRWAAAIVGGPLARPPGAEDAKRITGTRPDDGGLVDWFREGHTRLVETLAAADPAVECWSFLPAPSPVAFWARRQAHETAVHRMDAEAAAGGTAAVSADLAVDGVDELLFGFFARRNGRITADPPRTLAVRAVDTGDAWLVTIAPHGVDTERAEGAAECTVTGNAGDLYALLWNRRGATGLTVTGDASVLELWRTRAHVVWS
ncbi:maleylpyruvate isomerase family mycothiol-dependent enzyme [Thermobifida halotolerans]|uniref:Maleylpyruvate isomerase family mycothiol-dependent enzyme n=1 Tax=Thermobifida halotolerans TaxID=483545 RepID=A0A399G1P9_9ACTN|nr:maleylpyruvate isomerase family mycothiol-dependent enzyme [Thermobifida halotolerans]